MKQALMRKSSVLLIFSMFVFALSGNVMGMAGYPVPPELKPAVFDDSTVSKSLPITWNSWKEGQTYDESIGAGFLIDRISFKAAENSGGIVVVSVDKLERVPTSINTEPSDQIYGLGQISYNKFASASEVMLYFKVEKKWLSDKGLSSDGIMVMGYDSNAGAWTRFETELVSEETLSYSAAISPETQIFSVVVADKDASTPAERMDATEMPVEEEAVDREDKEPQDAMEKTQEAPVVETEFVVDNQDAGDAMEKTPEVPERPGSEGSSTSIIILILVLLAATGAGLFYYKNKKKGSSS